MDEYCGNCQHFDTNFINEHGHGHCALLTHDRYGGVVQEHQHCALNPPVYAERTAVQPAPLGKIRRI